MGIFAWIKIRVLIINGSLGYHKRNFHDVHISGIFKKRELSENIYSAKILTFTVFKNHVLISCSSVFISGQ